MSWEEQLKQCIALRKQIKEISGSSEYVNGSINITKDHEGNVFGTVYAEQFISDDQNNEILRAAFSKLFGEDIDESKESYEIPDSKMPIGYFANKQFDCLITYNEAQRSHPDIVQNDFDAYWHCDIIETEETTA